MKLCWMRRGEPMLVLGPNSNNKIMKSGCVWCRCWWRTLCRCTWLLCWAGTRMPTYSWWSISCCWSTWTSPGSPQACSTLVSLRSLSIFNWTVSTVVSKSKSWIRRFRSVSTVSDAKFAYEIDSIIAHSPADALEVVTNSATISSFLLACSGLSTSSPLPHISTIFDDFLIILITYNFILLFYPSFSQLLFTICIIIILIDRFVSTDEFSVFKRWPSKLDFKFWR